RLRPDEQVGLLCVYVVLSAFLGVYAFGRV
ncbi:unnamed protein product, partial [marine sediment metagenome]